jgi:hypothetical protein
MASRETVTRGMYGGNGGTSFNADTCFATYGFPTGVEVQFGQFVHGFRFHYGSAGSSAVAGAEGPQSSTFSLGANEFITQVEIYAGDYVEAVRFHTNEGRVSPRFGSQTSSARMRKAEADGKGLVAAAGRSGGWLDAVTFHFSSTVV